MHERSCADCHTQACDGGEGGYPAFCPTAALTDAQRETVRAAYLTGEEGAAAIASAEVECEGYLRLTRVEEIMAFAKKLGFSHLGVASCVGLIRETRALTKILRAHGFDVTVTACKVGAMKKVDIGINEACNAVGETMCNPILQAQLLNEANTQLNIVMGLCVGHDSLFYRHARALATTLVAKDRVLGHNPCAALYQAEGYYKKLLKEG